MRVRMASKQRKLKRFTGTRPKPPLPRSAEKSGSPAGGKPSTEAISKVAPTAASRTPALPAKPAAIENKPPQAKPARPAPHSRHTWSPPRLPFAHEIPSMYHETYVRMIPRGPHHVFSFWEMTPEDFEKVKGTGGEDPGKSAGQPVMRLYSIGPDKGKKPRRIGDVSIMAGVHSHYVQVPESGRRYRAELGVMTQSGRFIPVCRSNEAVTPRARVKKTAENGKIAGDARKLIDFSLLSGRMIAEADRDSETLFTEDDGLFAVEAGDEGATPRTTISSWCGRQLTQGTSAQ